MDVLVVCTGNLCRSPMAHALLEHELARRGMDDVRVTSAGTWAMRGDGATEPAIEVLRDEGIDFCHHRSTPLTAEALEAADIVIAMTSVHLREIAELNPDSTDKTFLLKELAELELEGAGLPALLAAGRPSPRRSLDLDDPMGGPRSSYDRAFGEIRAGIEALLRIISARAPKA